MPNKVREIRKKFEWTIRELAEKAGVTQMTVINLEKKQSDKIYLETAKKIALAFSKRIEEIF